MEIHPLNDAIGDLLLDLLTRKYVTSGFIQVVLGHNHSTRALEEGN
jgi:hypothetical protein